MPDISEQQTQAANLIQSQIESLENAAQTLPYWQIYRAILGESGGGGGSIDISTLTKEATLQGLISSQLGASDGTTAGSIIARLAAAVTNLEALVTGISGTVSIDNFPATQPISGAVSVSNFPGTQAVNGTVSISGGVISAQKPTAVFTGRKTVATAGTAEAISAGSQSLTDGLLLVQAMAANTGVLYVGGSGVSSSTGYSLWPGQSIPIRISNTNLIFINPSVNGEGISYFAS